MSDQPATPCPLCGSDAYPWLALPARRVHASVGLPVPGSDDSGLPPADTHVVDRCTGCDSGILAAPGEVDLAAELELITEPAGDGVLIAEAPNRASVQAWIGAGGWAALDDWRGRLLCSPRGLRLLAERTGRRVERIGHPPLGRSQVWMWQTLINGLTLHTNFAHEVRAGRLRPANARSHFAFWADAVATVLAAPLVLLVSFPLELIAALLRRGGRLEARIVLRSRT